MRDGQAIELIDLGRRKSMVFHRGDVATNRILAAAMEQDWASVISPHRPSQHQIRQLACLREINLKP